MPLLCARLLTIAAERFAYGVVSRLPRIYRAGAIVYGSYSLPAGTVISMSNADVSHDEVIFSDSRTFNPDRWLNDAHAPDGRPLARYLVTFGKGPRACLGMHLAEAELYIGLANFFRRVDAKLYETTARDVSMQRDVLVARAPKDSQGIRVQIV